MPTHFGVSILLLHRAIFRQFLTPMGLGELACWQRAAPQSTLHTGTASHPAHCAWIKHKYPQAIAIAYSEVPFKAAFFLMASTSSPVFEVVRVSPSTLHLAEGSAISHHVLGHGAPWRMGLCLCITSKTGAMARAHCGWLTEACVGWALPYTTTALTHWLGINRCLHCQGWQGGGWLVLAPVTEMSLFKISFCSVFVAT